jgi:2-hydroxychromene-2-carboxylate isomerase
MAKDKIKELEYKIEGLKRMSKRKGLRARKSRIKALNSTKLSRFDDWEDVGNKKTKRILE